MPISFDTTGLQQTGPTAWANPGSDDKIEVKTVEGQAFEPSWMHDLGALRRGFAGMYGEAGCLIELERYEIVGVPVIYQVVKVPHPALPAGQVFMAIYTLPKTPVYAQLIYAAAESGMTGIREATLMAQLGMPADWTRPHPFDPSLRTRLPFHRGDDPAFDRQFPDHPLSRARAWAGHIGRTMRIDPAFAAQANLG
ncbi:hypothetical protein [Glycomyces sp. MUSA5-2]|uniref:hypothetical protein n=1 Tax=Glycomyces sp. MUSA5-2 TaxID=2053002 RepID=UPI0030088EF4